MCFKEYHISDVVGRHTNDLTIGCRDALLVMTAKSRHGRDAFPGRICRLSSLIRTGHSKGFTRWYQ